MFLCFVLFISMFVFVFGIGLLVLVPSAMNVIFFDMIPLPMGIMTVGFLLSLILLLMIRSLGDVLINAEEKTFCSVARGSMWLGLIAGVAICAIQVYLRIQYGEWGFFATGDNLMKALRGTDFTAQDSLLVFIGVALSFFLGLFPFLFICFGGDFSRYVTVTYTHLSDGSSYESNRSESYVSIAQFVIGGLLLTIPFIFLSMSMLGYFFAAAYGVFVFGLRSKKFIITTSIIFGAIALALTVFSLLPNLGIVY